MPDGRCVDISPQIHLYTLFERAAHTPGVMSTECGQVAMFPTESIPSVVTVTAIRVPDNGRGPDSSFFSRDIE
jgi:hypothetical protein